MTADVTTDSGYFAIVPEWLLDADVSGNAIKLYAILARYADQSTKFAHPSRRTLAERMGVSRVATISALLEQLAAVGAIEILERYDERGDQLANGYIVKRIRTATAPTEPTEPVDNPAPPVRETVRGPRTVQRTPPVRSRVPQEDLFGREPENQSQGAASGPAPSPTCGKHPNGTTQPCRPCGDARRRWDARAEEHEALAAAQRHHTLATKYPPDVYCEHLQLRTGDCDACAQDARSALAAAGFPMVGAAGSATGVHA